MQVLIAQTYWRGWRIKKVVSKGKKVSLSVRVEPIFTTRFLNPLTNCLASAVLGAFVMNEGILGKTHRDRCSVSSVHGLDVCDHRGDIIGSKNTGYATAFDAQCSAIGCD
jgi:hypothetical protein